MDLDYTCEKLDAALATLAQSTESLPSRLADAYRSQLCRSTADDFPEELRGDFRLITHELSKIAPRASEGSIEASAAWLGAETARELIAHILELKRGVCCSRE